MGVGNIFIAVVLVLTFCLFGVFENKLYRFVREYLGVVMGMDVTSAVLVEGVEATRGADLPQVIAFG